MTLEFGELPVRIRKIVYYTLASSDQRVWAKFIFPGLQNFLMRSFYTSLPMAPAFLLTFWLMKWSPEEHRRSKRKDPNLYL